MTRTRVLVGRAVKFALIAWGLVSLVGLVVASAFDSSPLDNFDLDLHLSWVRSGPKNGYAGQMDGVPPPATVEGWPVKH